MRNLIVSNSSDHTLNQLNANYV